MYLYTTGSLVLNSIHFHAFLAFFLFYFKNFKDAVFPQLFCSSANMQLFRSSAETQVFCNFYADLRIRSFSAALQIRSFSVAFPQTCVKAAETQVFHSFYAQLFRRQKLRKSRRYWHLRKSCIFSAVEFNG